MPQTKISPKDIQPGDVVSFFNHLGNKTGHSATPRTGLVYNIAYAADGKKVLGFEILELTPHPTNRRIENDRTHLMIGRKSQTDIQDMGLDTNQNHRLHYNILVVANAAEHLSPQGKNGKGGVIKKGSIAGSNLFNLIVNHADSLKLSHSGLTGLGLKSELNTLQGPSDRSMDVIETFRMGEQGKRNKHERRRQDDAEADATAVKIGAGSNTPTEKIKGKKPRANQASTGRVVNISLEDAARIGLISAEIASALGKKAGRQKAITSLKEASQSAPEKLSAHFKASAKTSSLLTIGEVAEKLHDPDFIDTLSEKLEPKSLKFILADFKDAYETETDDTPLKDADLYDITIRTFETTLSDNLDPSVISKELKAAWKTFMNDVLNGAPDNDERYDGIDVYYA